MSQNVSSAAVVTGDLRVKRSLHSRNDMFMTRKTRSMIIAHLFGQNERHKNK